MSKKPELETWKNPTAGKIWISRLDENGRLRDTEIYGPGRTFHITREERVWNQEQAYSPEADMFGNGTLIPVHIIDAEDARELASNPNLMSETEMGALLSRETKVEAFVERLEQVTNPTTLQRLVEKAREEDVPVSRLEAIQRRLGEVTMSVPETNLINSSVSAPPPIRPTTPR